MQPPFPQKPQPEPENKFPDCLYMKLEGIPIQPDSLDYLDSWQVSTETRQIDLHLTINFNEQWELLPGGRIKFGLKGGELRVKLENSEIPFESRELAGSWELSVPTAKKKSQIPQDKKSREIRANNLNASVNGSQIKAKESAIPEQSLSTFNQLPVNICHITTKVSEENPAWVFEEEMGELVLKGSLNQAKLATLNMTALPCRVEATFEVSKRDVCLTDAEGLWPADISRNKRAVLDRLIVQRLLEPKFKPYLSKAELHYD